MIILSNKSKDSILEVSKLRNMNIAKKVMLGFDFGRCLGFDSMNEVFEYSFREYMTEPSAPSLLFDVFDEISEGEVYCYVINEDSSVVRHISIAEMLESEDKDYFTVGVLLAVRKKMNDLDTDLEYEINFSDRTFSSINTEILKEYVLSKDIDGRASLIVDMAKDDEELYSNVKRLDSTGRYISVYYALFQSYRSDIGERLLEVDKDGEYIIETLNWLKTSPEPFASKMIELGNPFKVVDFRVRYEDYVNSLKSCNEEMEFVTAKSDVLNILDGYLMTCNYSEMIDKLYDKSIFYENNSEFILNEILTIAKLVKNEDVVVNLLNAVNKKNEAFIDNLKPITKNDIELVSSMDMNEYTIFHLDVDGVNVQICKSKEDSIEFLKFLLQNKYETISIKELF